ncbi:MAG: hypothetical protein OWS74_05930 [Firmicutes bacterium]|nr:hypothetical protein [Bacillota bacterium]
MITSMIKVVLDDQFGALPRLLLLFNQRNIMIQQMTVAHDDRKSEYAVILGVNISRESERRLLRYIARDGNVRAVERIDGRITALIDEESTTSFDSPGQRNVALADENIERIPLTAAHAVLVRGMPQDIGRWAENAQCRLEAVWTERSSATAAAGSKTSGTTTKNSGGIQHERKIILRRRCGSALAR